MTLTIDFCGECFAVNPGQVFSIGREGDLALDDNQFLHRKFLRFANREWLWSVANVGSRLAATVADAAGYSHAWLAPGGEVPLVFERTAIRFSAGRTSYEVLCLLEDPVFSGSRSETAAKGAATRGMQDISEDQRLLILALAEPAIRAGGTVSQLPTSAQAARRLGWTIGKFNRKLDLLCAQLANAGARGLHGSAGNLASGRRARLVEYALTMRLVSVDDLHLLGRTAIQAQPMNGGTGDGSANR